MNTQIVPTNYACITPSIANVTTYDEIKRIGVLPDTALYLGTVLNDSEPMLYDLSDPLAGSILIQGKSADFDFSAIVGGRKLHPELDRKFPVEFVFLTRSDFAGELGWQKVFTLASRLSEQSLYPKKATVILIEDFACVQQQDYLCNHYMEYILENGTRKNWKVIAYSNRTIQESWINEFPIQVREIMKPFYIIPEGNSETVFFVPR